MKKTILLMLALALLCTALCACSEGGHVNGNEGGFVTDRGNDSNIGDDIKDGAEDVGEGIKDGAEDITNPDASPAQPQATAVPGTQVITP